MSVQQIPYVNFGGIILDIHPPSTKWLIHLENMADEMPTCTSANGPHKLHAFSDVDGCR